MWEQVPAATVGQKGSANSAVHTGEREFRRLLEKLPAGAYTCDPEGLITYYNQQAVQLWGRAPKLNDPVDRFCGSFKLFAPDGLPINHDQCWMALALKMNKEYNGHEIVIERPDGQRLTALAYANPIQDESGNLLGAVNVLVDVSDRKRAENALKQADRSKNEFLAVLAHELRNPLAPMRTAVEILRLKAMLSSEMEGILDMLDRQIQQMTRLIDDLLNIARITANKLELRKERIELTEVLHAALEISRPLIEDRGQELVVTVPSCPLYLDADRTRLAQVVSNLLNNASKYTESGGHIWLTAMQEGTEAVVTVRDTGIGIRPDVLPRIFEMFTQADLPLDGSPGGLGIGLTLVKQLVELHGGTISAHSPGPGQGSEFVVRLPIATQPEQILLRERCDTEHITPASLRRLLVVDDDRISVACLKMLLQLKGHDVRTAHDGYEAVDVADEFRPDAVLMDIGLPQLNGYDAARRIRQQPWGKDMMLIAVTGWGQEADRRCSKEAGFDHHLVKPVSPSALLQLLASLPRITH